MFYLITKTNLIYKIRRKYFRKIQIILRLEWKKKVLSVFEGEGIDLLYPTIATTLLMSTLIVDRAKFSVSFFIPGAMGCWRNVLYLCSGFISVHMVITRKKHEIWIVVSFGRPWFCGYEIWCRTVLAMLQQQHAP